ncbi:uncharacterized protein EV586_106145 [Tumebacillus sp. BK434]|uniref:TPM domain-containing protein n=1 Tax=Tumebacillus sp. BK434 TaxID=2512169 RepID=UPI001047C822|nr:TPM domain-containing protein [Tumebacillus sp. BK434]TCP53396.1 uncharacterized protein EV586_106145 [Tumebacillus sp. BK434]
MKKLFPALFLFVILLSLFSFPAQAANVYDKENLLSASEKQLLEKRIQDIAATYHFDVVIVTVDSLNGKSAMEYADDYYDENGFGFGPNHDGLLFLLAMDSRDYWTSTSGYGIKAFTDYGIRYISDNVVGLLSEGEYYRAFDKYLDYVDMFLAEAATGTPFDIEHTVKTSNYYLIRVSLTVAISAAIAFLVVGIMKSKMKTANKQRYALNYVKEGSFQVTSDKDLFLYTTTTRQKVESSSSSGGSSTHSSSSGNSHGGGGGKF